MQVFLDSLRRISLEALDVRGEARPPSDQGCHIFDGSAG
jgi:hypothetical protein